MALPVRIPGKAAQMPANLAGANALYDNLAILTAGKGLEVAP